jgi:2-oxo-3-hexenedioate decarboxylase/2-keto-4-pentenoate hydratase
LYTGTITETKGRSDLVSFASRIRYCRRRSVPFGATGSLDRRDGDDMDPTADRHRRAAEILRDARLARTPIDRLPENCRPRDEPDGYAVQEALHGLLTGAGLGPVAGHKIGCTTPVMQAYLGIRSPCAGGVHASTVRHGEARVGHGDYLRVGVECEIAVRLGEDLGPAGAPFDRARVAPAVEAVLVAMEIVDDRYRDYRSLDVPTLIADDFFNAGCVLGPPVARWRDLDLPALAGVTRLNGAAVGRGEGRAVMGHPFEALAWLANLRARRGLALHAGEFVLLGSVVETRWVGPGDEVAVAVEGLGEVSALFRT